ncbi:ABC transporter ATP-binding protein [Paractinoplanes lichenicola]|uniref:ABC transporter ATP-binding protein n=1 Tax=Paractinoplanes lichenicola TaxID=2802976 RepID=A0ABS1VVX5_9ACTN|nr:ABC transporter ATP-binding protein [Actinoplanes lichenicola]MBL7258612.1 ABC transporter ATP-binding protein [Actinoplanes lichenicola]
MRIEIAGLTKTFRGGVAALDGLDLTVPTGMFGLLGANGAGKTTLMRILAGIARPTAGRVTVGGHDLATTAGRHAVQRGLGYLPQDLGVYPDLTARQFLDYVALLKGLDDPTVRRRRVGELLEVVALTGQANRRLRGFSGGMRQRVGIAQALLADPRLLIVDEPTAGLDPEERIRFRTLLSQFAGDRTVLLSTHIVDDIAQTCREVAVLSRGRLAFRGTVESLTREAAGRVWSLTTAGPPPPDGTVVSALPAAEGGMRYRIVAATAPGPTAQPLEPALEDGYLTVAAPERSALNA